VSFQVRTDRNFWSVADNALRCLLAVSGPVDTLGSLNLVERKSAKKKLYPVSEKQLAHGMYLCITNPLQATAMATKAQGPKNHLPSSTWRSYPTCWSEIANCRSEMNSNQI